ncbi:MAG: YezD family protein [Lachnospiraceae bacterium]|nr:YezD family protein [Lachnospiraceae bacterium]
MKEVDNNSIVDNSHLKKIEDLIRDLKFGSITIVVQDGKIVQIDKTEKYRIKN